MKLYIDKMYKKSKEEYFEYVKERLIKEEKTFIITANPEILMLGEQNKEFDKILMDEQTEIIPDGIGVIKGAKFFDINIKERITGVELVEKLLNYCNEHQKSIYLFGAKQEVIEKMEEVIKEKYHNCNLVGTQNGYVKDKQKVFDEIAKKQPDVVLVALGAPNQEKLIYENLSKFNKGIFVGVGGSFDVISGMKKRAPKIFIKLNLEWLYRIAFHPDRWKRFYNGNIKYILKIKKEAKEKI